MDFLEILFQVSELVAAVAGTIFIIKYRTNILVRYFVYYLWFNFIVEIFGNLPVLIIKYDFLSFLRDSFLSDNHWLYNVHLLISCSFYTFFFYSSLTLVFLKRSLLTLYSVFLLSSIVNLLVTDVFFQALSLYTMIVGVFIILISVFFYFFEMLRSEKILKFSEDLVFYVGIGTTVLHLLVTPIVIYDTYYSKANIEFIKIRIYILYSAIIFAYTCYTIGFVVCSRKNKSY